MNDFSSNSFRLLAMAVGVIPKAAQLSLVHMTQQQVEASALNMHLLCLLVLTNNIRSDSKATVTHLQEGYAFGQHQIIKVVIEPVCPGHLPRQLIGCACWRLGSPLLHIVDNNVLNMVYAGQSKVLG